MCCGTIVVPFILALLEFSQHATIVSVTKLSNGLLRKYVRYIRLNGRIDCMRLNNDARTEQRKGKSLIGYRLVTDWLPLLVKSALYRCMARWIAGAFAHSFASFPLYDALTRHAHSLNIELIDMNTWKHSFLVPFE